MKLKEKNNKLLLLSLYSIGILIFGIFIGAIFYPLFKPVSIPDIPVCTPTPEGSNINLKEDLSMEREFDKGKRWRLFAHKVNINTNTNKGTILDVTCTYNEDKNEKIKIISDVADIDFNKETLTFGTKVKAVSKAGEILETDKLIWNHKSKEALGEGNVTLLKDNIVITGDKIKADIVLFNYILSGNVEIIKVKENRKKDLKEMFIKRKD